MWDVITILVHSEKKCVHVQRTFLIDERLPIYFLLFLQLFFRNKATYLRKTIVIKNIELTRKIIFKIPRKTYVRRVSECRKSLYRADDRTGTSRVRGDSTGLRLTKELRRYKLYQSRAEDTRGKEKLTVAVS